MTWRPLHNGLLLAAAALLAAIFVNGIGKAADDAVKPVESLSDLTAVEAAANAARRELDYCLSLREGLQIALDSQGTILLLRGDGVHVITMRHVEELVARLRLLQVIQPDLIGPHKEGLAIALGIPELALDGILDSDSLLGDAAAPTLMAALRQHYAGGDAAARESMRKTVETCRAVEASATTYLDSLEVQRRALWPAGTVTYGPAELQVNGVPLDLCTAPGPDPVSGTAYPCEYYAAQVFCESRGHLVQLSFKWEYMARTAYPDGTICDTGSAFGCSGFTEIMCGNDPG